MLKKLRILNSNFEKADGLGMTLHLNTKVISKINLNKLPKLKKKTLFT